MKIIHNARVYLHRGNRTSPGAPACGDSSLGGESFAQAILIEGDRIVLTGSNEEILSHRVPGTETVDARGALVLPGFIDSHLHLQWVGRRMGSIEAAGACSVEEVLDRGRQLLRERKPVPGTYIQGAGVNPDLFTGEKRDLHRRDLDSISTEHPIILSRHCGHTIYCNSLALEKAGFGERAPAIKGGLIEVDEQGRPTGVCRENANALIRAPMPPPGDEEIRGDLERAMRKALSLGITAAGSYDTQGEDFNRIREIYQSIYAGTEEGGFKPLRVTMQCGIAGQERNLDFYLTEGFTTGRVLTQSGRGAPLLTMGPLKLFADGTLGGRTAWMRRPYRDKPETSGFPVIEPNYLQRIVWKAAAGGLQVFIHAIGDAGIDLTLRAFEEVTKPGHNPLRHGIIHCQITSPDLIARMARNGILVLAQPIFLADDQAILESRVGPDLAATSYAWGSLDRAGVEVSYGTDAPVSSLNPLECISWAVNRRDPERDPRGAGYSPGEKVDVFTAVDAYTRGSAFSSFNETRMGRIAPGFLADLVFLDRDIFSLAGEEIPRAKVLQTWLGGEVVYEG